MLHFFLLLKDLIDIFKWLYSTGTLNIIYHIYYLVFVTDIQTRNTIPEC